MTADLPAVIVRPWGRVNVAYDCPSCHGGYVLTLNGDGTATCDACQAVCRIPERES